jgi:hypothetical protein
MLNFGRKLTVAILLLGAGILLEAKSVAGQVYCYDCIDDDLVYEHRMSVLPPPWGWYAAPCEGGSHPWWIQGACLFRHYAGCFHEEDASPEDGDLLQQLAKSEGDVLRRLVESRSEDLLILEDLGVIAVQGCDDVFSIWMPLRETQLRA